MRWTDLSMRPETKVLRQFALMWMIFFSGLGLFQWLAQGRISTAGILVALGLLFGIPGLVRPGTLRWLYVACMLAAFPIGWLLSQVMLATLFYGIITPIALLFRLRKRDLLRRRLDPKTGSLWSPSSGQREARSYLRQF